MVTVLEKEYASIERDLSELRKKAARVSRLLNEAK